MKTIRFNDQELLIEDTLSLQALLDSTIKSPNCHPQNHFAIAINNQFIPRSSYAKVCLKDGDFIDVIIPMQGG